jgi:hypothetical protein
MLVLSDNTTRYLPLVQLGELIERCESRSVELFFHLPFTFSSSCGLPMLMDSMNIVNEAGE